MLLVREEDAAAACDATGRFITYEPASGYGASSIEPRLVRALGEHADHFLGVWQGPDSVPSKDGSRKPRSLGLPARASPGGSDARPRLRSRRCPRSLYR